MENGFLDKVEDNAAVRMWSEKTQLERGDSLAGGYTSELWDYARISLFSSSYGDLPYLLDIKVDEHLFRAFAQYWNPAYSCFTFGKVDLVPTIEEYIALLRCSMIQADKVCSRAVNVPTFAKKLMNITGMSEQWVTARIKQKGKSKCIPWKSLQELILAHPDARKKVDVFTLSIYELVIFPNALGHVDEAATDLFDQLDKRVTPVLTILNLHEEDIEWRPPWLLPDEILYRCGNFDWVPLLEIWGAVGYAPLMVLRQYRSRQFIPATQGLAESEFSYKDDGYKKKIREITRTWDQTRRIKRLAVGPMTTPEYNEWWVRRINDNIPRSSQGDSQSIEEHLRVVPSELEIMKQDFDKRNAELEKKI
ncbi:uncharacterized protein LOC105801086 [Gossypium raimondii]|uniref:uncharacterized protein LOC105801086 n=1 Tax=Gossypium raimondii TaxID=29730 RepID=UPI00063AB7D5|nr:uncharacterized protein LOC105801086 [Gossypium raimondii]